MRALIANYMSDHMWWFVTCGILFGLCGMAIFESTILIFAFWLSVCGWVCYAGHILGARSDAAFGKNLKEGEELWREHIAYFKDEPAPSY
jgi:hypothetical protein